MSTIDNSDMTIPEFHIPLDALDDSKTRKQLSPAGFRLFNGFCNRWGFDKNQRFALLGDVSPQTYRKWEREGASSLSRDQLERISLLLGIHKCLKILFVDHGSARRWFFSLNHDQPFDGISPSEFMIQGSISNLYGVRRYLEAWIQMK
ncbi:MAG: helix-turn-helix transcriptional regulator [Rhodobacteraceae bacterium]|nr:helix-turn-helix transcriptional regulator [Paracoccaceae bacterium]MYF46295.1 helix-turn-helix transcriptional regulator [Paracoccaceae bacterium]